MLWFLRSFGSLQEISIRLLSISLISFNSLIDMARTLKRLSDKSGDILPVILCGRCVKRLLLGFRCSDNLSISEQYVFLLYDYKLYTIHLHFSEVISKRAARTQLLLRGQRDTCQWVH